MSRIAVLVDAGYLFKAGSQLLVGGTGAPQRELAVNLEAFAAQITATIATFSSKPLLRIYWYDAAPVTGPTPQHRQIAEAPLIKLRLGYLNSERQQKGVDPLIITDMITLARNRACDDMLLLAGDGDLVVGVTQAQEHGAQVHLLGVGASRGNQAPQLRQEADCCHQWELADVERFLRHTPRTVDFASTQTVGSPQNQPLTPTETSVPTPVSAPTPTTTSGPVAPELLKEVAVAVAVQLDSADRTAVTDSPIPGRVPGMVDRKLFGNARQMLGVMLNDSEKRVLRRLLFEACLEIATATPTEPAIKAAH
ncbi:MAG: NYN domain-containing protein [Gemmatimonas sp.]|jgi:hypothetical protein|uniref:NYN domain-containing protein n=1 Tax=Gemmatimonas sp. TaxID=1962908 RepID=UPI0031C6FF89|nr:NYN domain-containing protein [Gemmatimonas sp.]